MPGVVSLGTLRLALSCPSMKGAGEGIPQAQGRRDDTIPPRCVGRSAHFKRECEALITPIFNGLLDDHFQRTAVSPGK